MIPFDFQVTCSKVKVKSLCCPLNIFWPLHLINTKLGAGFEPNKYMIPIHFQVPCLKVKVKLLFWAQCVVHFIYFNPLLTCFGQVLIDTSTQSSFYPSTKGKMKLTLLLYSGFVIDWVSFSNIRKTCLSAFLFYFNCMNIKLFSSTELKVQVSFSDLLSSIVCLSIHLTVRL